MSKLTDFKAIVRPKSPNTYLLAPAALCGDAAPDAPSPDFNAGPGALFKMAHDLALEWGWTVQVKDDTARHMEAVATTRVLKFKDDIAIETISVDGDPEKSKIAVYSRSRVGYSDLGANRKRVQKLVAELMQRTGTTA